MDINEIQRIENEAITREAEEAATENQQAEAGQPFALPDVAEQFADFLDIAAKVAGHGLNVPTIPQRFTHGANVEIATAAVKLCEKYGIDARSVLIGEDSTIGAWLGLVVAIGLPGYAVYMDIKAIKAKEAKEKEVKEAANDGEYNQQQSK